MQQFQHNLQLWLTLAVFALGQTAIAKPNIVLLVADDLGFADLGSYGSEVSTPNIDSIAAGGLRFSNYHTPASCAPTRAMLMTGMDSHTAGVANIPEAIPADQAGAPGYGGVLSGDVPTIAERLRDVGYRTYLSGKWHLGKTLEQLPVSRGFDRSFVMADTGADNWEQKSYLPIYDRANWFEDDRRITLPDDFYSSKNIVDKTIEYVDSTPAGTPFFSYIAFQAVHIPVQAPAEFRDKYIGTYSKGWHALKEARTAGLVRSGIFSEPPAAVDVATTMAWGTADQEQFEARMSVYAGMIEAMDHHVGRLVKHIDTRGELDNTVFVFVSDNGAEASIISLPGPKLPEAASLWFRTWMWLNGYHTNVETMGEIGSYGEIGPSWASAAVGPLAWYKFSSGEGGMRVPMVIGGQVDGTPVVAQRGNVADGFAWATDITATLLELAGADLDDSISGRSLVPVFLEPNQRVRGENEAVGYELAGNKALFRGPYKLVLDRGAPDADWRLYDIEKDPGETRDLKTELPHEHQAMIQAWDAWALQHQVLPVTEDYQQTRQVFLNGLADRPVLWLTPLAMLLAIIVILAWLVRILVRRWS